MCRLFPYIPIFKGVGEGGGLLKSVKKYACALVLNITLSLVKSACFGAKKGISEFWRQVAQKQPTQMIILFQTRLRKKFLKRERPTLMNHYNRFNYCLSA